MSKIIYKKLNFNIESDVKTVAIIHEEAPINWMKSYVINPVEVSKRIKYLISKKEDGGFYVNTARESKDNIIGIHWIETVEHHGKKGGHIGSLCVKESFRGQGIGTELKRRGELWAKESGLQFISTEVYYSNKEMLDFNHRLGFEFCEVRMVKELL